MRNQHQNMQKFLILIVMAAVALPAWAADAPAPAPATATETAATNAAAAVHVDAKLSTTTPTFGDAIELVATLRYPNTYRVFFPAHPNLRPLLADPNNAGKSERQESGGQITETIHVPLLVVKSGLLRTPAIEVPFHIVTAGGGAGESGSVTVPSMKIVVKSQFANDNNVSPSPLPKPRPLIEENVPLEIALGVLAMMLLSAGLTALGLKVYKNRAALLRPKPVVPPHLQAFGRLTELERSGRLANETPRVVVAELSEILREYLGGRFRFYALDMTSTELLERVKALDLKHVRLDEVQRFTDTSDLVKFAGLPATPEELVEMHLYVREVIEKTMQTAQELELQRAAETARLALQKKLRLQVMAPTALRVRALALDLAFGSVATCGLAFLAMRTGRQGLFDAAYALWFVWLALRDAVGGSSPGKAITGLEIAAYEVETSEARRAWNDDAPPEDESFLIAQMASWGAKLKRNLLLAVPGAGFVAEAWTALALPEQRRFGDQWAGTRVIDARHGRRKGKPTWWPAALAIVVALTLWLLPLVLGGRPA
jgi:hypothetical protein